MKKLKLSNNLTGNLLSREQLKKVLGGVMGSDSGSGDPNPKKTACIGKKNGDPCSWIYHNVVYNGYCRHYGGDFLHCSTLM